MPLWLNASYTVEYRVPTVLEYTEERRLICRLSSTITSQDGELGLGIGIRAGLGKGVEIRAGIKEGGRCSSLGVARLEVRVGVMA